MHDFIIDRSANRGRKSAIAFEGRVGARVANHLIRRIVDFKRRHARFDHIAKLEQYLSHELARRPHFFDLSLRFTNNH